MLTVKEAADYLHFTVATVYKKVCQGELPCYKPNGGRIYFDQAELDLWLRRGHKAAHFQLEDQALALRGGRR